MGAQAVPAGYHTVTPYLIVEGADAFVDFLTKAFDAELVARMEGPNGTIGHAEAQIGDSRVMLAESNERWPRVTGMLHLYLEDCDAVYRRALDAGATSVQEPEDQFYGDRMAGVRDAFGNVWWLATRVEDVSEEEMARRAKQRAAQSS